MCVMEMISKKLNDLLDEKNIKAGDLSKAIDVNASTISRVLKGTQKPTVDTLYKIAKFFNLTMEYFMMENESLHIDNCVDATCDDVESRLLFYIHNIPPVEQAELLMLAQMKYEKVKNEAQEMGKLSLSVQEINTGIA